MYTFNTNYLVLNKIAEIITNADFFYVSVHKKIYSVMLEMFTCGEAVDYVTLLEKLQARQKPPRRQDDLLFPG